MRVPFRKEEGRGRKKGEGSREGEGMREREGHDGVFVSVAMGTSVWPSCPQPPSPHPPLAPSPPLPPPPPTPSLPLQSLLTQYLSLSILLPLQLFCSRLAPRAPRHVGGAAGTRTVGWAGLLLVRMCALLVLHARTVELEWQLLKTVLR